MGTALIYSQQSPTNEACRGVIVSNSNNLFGAVYCDIMQDSQVVRLVAGRRIVRVHWVLQV